MSKDKSAKVRDPRKDPSPGDVVIYGPQWQRERAEVVEIRNNGDIEYAINGHPFCIWRRGWVDLMEGAEVLHVAGA